MNDMNFIRNPFWRKWIISCAADELLGIGCAGAIEGTVLGWLLLKTRGCSPD